jgi:hypothetical protein
MSEMRMQRWKAGKVSPGEVALTPFARKQTKK